MKNLNMESKENQNGDRLQLVVESLKEMNKFIQPEKSIQMILFLWSQFSQKSVSLINSMPNECKRFFYFINIDNPDIRESILNSSNVKVSQVPCIIVVQNDGVISTYEGDSSIDIIKSVYAIVQKIIQQNRPKKPPSTVTPLSEILLSPDIDSNEDGQESQENDNSNMKFKCNGPSEVCDSDDDPETRHSAVRSKIRRAERPMDTGNRIVQQNHSENGLSSSRVHFNKGDGHHGLAVSSLGADIKKSSQKQKQPPKLMKVYGGEILDDELDDMLDEDPTLDPVIRDNIGNSSIKTDKKESMMNVKKAAEDMARIREQEAEDDD